MAWLLASGLMPWVTLAGAVLMFYGGLCYGVHVERQHTIDQRQGLSEFDVAVLMQRAAHQPKDETWGG